MTFYLYLANSSFRVLILLLKPTQRSATEQETSSATILLNELTDSIFVLNAVAVALVVSTLNVVMMSMHEDVALMTY